MKIINKYRNEEIKDICRFWVVNTVELYYKLDFWLRYISFKSY